MLTSGSLAIALLVQVPAVKLFQVTRSLLLPSNMPVNTSRRASLAIAVVQPLPFDSSHAVQSMPSIVQPSAGLLSVDDSRKRPSPSTMSP